MKYVIAIMSIMLISGCAHQKQPLKTKNHSVKAKKSPVISAETKNLLEDIKIFHYYTEGVNLIFKYPILSLMKFSKAIELLEKKPWKYLIKSPYKSFTYQQLLCEIKFWRVCAAKSITNYGVTLTYVDHNGNEVTPEKDMDWLKKNGGVEYLKSKSINYIKILKVLEN